MKRFLAILVLLSLCLGSEIRAQDKPAGAADHSNHVLVRPDAVKWGAPPPGLPRDAQVAVLTGDPGKPVPFVLRLKLPDGLKIMPHTHPIDEIVTVLQGTLLVGHGDKLDPAAMEALPAGSFWHMSKGMSHFVMAKGETIIQIHGVGVFDITYINPADDPRKPKDKK